MLDIHETAKILRVKKRTVYQYVRDKKLRAYKPGGGKFLFDPKDVDAFIRAHPAADDVKVERLLGVVK